MRIKHVSHPTLRLWQAVLSITIDRMPNSRVLLVDDEPGIRLALRKWFERNGWQVDEADDGIDAFAQLESVNVGYGLVICDVHLPGIGGIDIASRVEQQWPELLSRFVLTTGDNLEFTAEQRMLRDKTHVLLKPFEFSVLHELLADVAHRSRSNVLS